MTDKKTGSIPIEELRSITLVPFPNGGWTVRLLVPSCGIVGASYPADLGAFTTADEMLAALHDELVNRG